MAGSLIEIYLRDHHAGSTGGVALAKRVAAANRGNAYGTELESIAVEIEADRHSLERIMQLAGASPSRARTLGSLAAERLARLKRNGRWASYSPLSRLFEIEALIMAVSGKRSLWHAIDAAGIDLPAGMDLDLLTSRADSQRERLEALRSRAATEALGS